MSTNNITKYCEYFQERLKEISLISNRLYQKILLVSMIDTLGRARFPAEGKQGKRFIDFIRECADWPDKNRISLYKLHLSLQADSTVMSGALAEEVKQRLGKWQKGRGYGINEVDPEMKDIEHLAKTEKEQLLIDKCKHINLFYIYRNYLVHEFREPESEFGSDGRANSPYYQSRITESNASTQQLVYPIGFFMAIAYSSIDKLKHHLENNKIDPYSSYKFGAMWHQK